MLLLTAVTCLAAAATADKASVAGIPWVTLYSEPDQQGNNLTLSGDVSLPDLRWWDVWTYCAVGCWVSYSDTHFSSWSRWRTLSANSGGYICIGAVDASGLPRSLRQVGNPDDIEGDSLSLFSGDFYSDERTYMSEDTPSIPTGGFVQSAVITGYQNWTLFSEENYAGNATCLEADEDLSWITLIDDLYPPIEVRSAKMGCNESTVRLEVVSDESHTIAVDDGVIRYSKEKPWKLVRRSLTGAEY